MYSRCPAAVDDPLPSTISVCLLCSCAVFPSDRRHLNEVMNKIKLQKSKEMKGFERKLQQQGGALSLV